jgi:hypothetical protein
MAGFFIAGEIMPRNGSGSYSLPSGNPVTPNTTISSNGWANPTLTDIAAALTASIAIDGQTVPTANLPMGNFRHTGAADGVNPGDYSTLRQLAASSGTSLIGTIGTLSGAVSRTEQSKNNDLVDARDVGVIVDGSTDQTGALTTVFSNNSSYRGVFRIPYNTKFTASTVYAALPVGYMLWDESSINTGQPPGYKNKRIRLVTNDTASDDSAQEIFSSHNPALRLNNLATAGTSSANGRYNSIIRGSGIRWNNDPIDGMQLLTFKSPRGNLWRTADLLNTSYNYAVNGKAQWQATTAYTLNTIVNTSAGNVYQCTVAGTSGSVAPSVTSGTQTDGTVTWTYLGPWSASSTIHYYDEDGYGGIIGTSTARFGAETANRKGLSINSNDSTHDVFLRDDQRNVDLLRLSDSLGLQHGTVVPSKNFGGNITGATPTLSSEFHTMTQTGATTVTNFVLPGTQTDGFVTILFLDGNSTLDHTGSFNLKGNVNVTPVSGNIMVFLKRASISSGWFEVSRNF